MSAAVWLPGAMAPGSVPAIYNHSALTLHVTKPVTIQQTTIKEQVAAGL